MAEINIEKRGRNPWPWIVAVVILVIVAIVLFAMTEREAPVTPVDDADVETFRYDDPRPPAIADFSDFIERHNADPDAATDHEFTGDGLVYLSDALESLLRRSDEDVMAFADHLEEIRARADSIQFDPTALDHADHVRASLTTAAEIMEAVQQRHAPERADDIAQLRSATERLRTDQPLLDQKPVIDDLFNRSRRIVDELDRRLTVDQG